VNAGVRVIGNSNNPALVVTFPAAVSNIRVFPNTDNLGAAYDG
jgi:hypothetical protein